MVCLVGKTVFGLVKLVRVYSQTIVPKADIPKTVVAVRFVVHVYEGAFWTQQRGLNLSTIQLFGLQV